VNRLTMNSRAGLGSGGTESTGQELDVLLLVSSDLADSAANPVREPGGGKVGGRELVEVLLVEGGLQVLQSPAIGERQVIESVVASIVDYSNERFETHKAYWRMVVSVTALCLFSGAGAAATKPKAATAAITAVENFIMN